MNSLFRLAGYSLILLLLFVVAAWAARGWLQQQTAQLRVEAVAAKQKQLFAAITTTRQPGQPWNAPYLEALGQMTGTTVRLSTQGNTESDPAAYSFEQEFTNLRDPPTLLRVSFSPPAATRLAALQQRALIGLALFAAALFSVYIGLILLSSRSRLEDGSEKPRTVRAEMRELTELAKTSAAQGEALGHERSVRQRAEEDAALKQRLLNQSLEERVRLGHDLHDGIIQSLYAVGLNLESARTLVPVNPAEADARLEKCRQSLNDIIRSVREYITGLAPENLRQLGFARALDAIIADLHAGQDVKFQLRIDDEAAALLNAEQSANALQIACEALSNSLRHAHSNSINVRLHQADREICLLIQDNGVGFDLRGPTDGHGLRNLQARTERLGGVARVESQKGVGTRVIVTLPVQSAS